MRIGIVAPSCTLDPAIAAQLDALGTGHDFIVSPQCYRRHGHFAGDDQGREDALVAMANDPAIDAVWFARGGYGACRIAETAIARMGVAARDKAYLGYSDAGFLLAGLYARGFERVAHGPMPSDMKRDRGAAAVLRSIAWFANPVRCGDGDGDGDRDGLGAVGLRLAPPLYADGAAKTVAFNLTVLSQLLGTPLEPDLTDHVLMIEDVAEHMYRIDRMMFHVTSSASIRKVAGIRMGRFSDIPGNDPDFGADAETVVRHWCERSGIAFLGYADIGHDADNKVVAFG